MAVTTGDEEGTGLEELTCDKCGRICETHGGVDEWGELPSEIQRCPACRSKYCSFCVFRIGGKEYCSRSCGVRYFFGGDDDDDEAIDDAG